MEDDTVRLPVPGAAPKPGPAPGSVGPASPRPALHAGGAKPGGSARPKIRPAVLAGVFVILLATAGGAAWLLWPGAPSQVAIPSGPIAPVSLSPPPPPAALRGPPELSEAEILELHPTEPRVVRLKDEPRVFVMLFPDLETQGAALNRVAALIEKRGLPRDRVLTDAELAAAIAANGTTAATYYYGHNYRGSDLERFFALADRQGIRLNMSEHWLRDQLAMLASLGLSAGEVAFISIPGLDERVDARMRRAILRHEVGHGHFFTNVVFAAHVRRVWRYDFTPADRAALTAYLARGGYDPAQEELMVNETMAYLLFTPDERFFSAEEVGLTLERLETLRRMLLEAAPPLAGQR